jgi:hypothetical protein
MAARKKPTAGLAASAPGAVTNEFTLGYRWMADPALKMPDPNVPMPVIDADAGEQQLRRAHGYGYSAYT